eukprot:3801343-Amphidinium_carterae.1
MDMDTCMEDTNEYMWYMVVTKMQFREYILQQGSVPRRRYPNGDGAQMHWRIHGLMKHSISMFQHATWNIAMEEHGNSEVCYMMMYNIRDDAQWHPSPHVPNSILQESRGRVHSVPTGHGCNVRSGMVDLRGIWVTLPCALRFHLRHHSVPRTWSGCSWITRSQCTMRAS